MSQGGLEGPRRSWEMSARRRADFVAKSWARLAEHFRDLLKSGPESTDAGPRFRETLARCLPSLAQFVQTWPRDSTESGPMSAEIVGLCQPNLARFERSWADVGQISTGINKMSQPGWDSAQFARFPSLAEIVRIRSKSRARQGELERKGRAGDVTAKANGCAKEAPGEPTEHKSKCRGKRPRGRRAPLQQGRAPGVVRRKRLRKGRSNG